MARKAPDTLEEALVPWKALPTDGSEIPADAHLRVDLKYAGIDPAALAQNGYQLAYYPDSLLDNIRVDTQVKVGGDVIGRVYSETVTADGREQTVIRMRFEKEYIATAPCLISTPNTGCFLAVKHYIL